MDFFNRNRKTFFILLIIFLLISIILSLNFTKPTWLNNTVGYIITPIQRETKKIQDYFSDKISGIKQKDEIEEEYERLREENAKLKMDLERLELIEKDNEELRKQLDLTSKYPQLNIVGADIIAKDNNNWSKSFLIGKGSQDGIKTNMVVLADGGLAGKVAHVGLNYAQVIPIVDDSSSVGGQIKKSGEYGFVKGDLKLQDLGYCKMDKISIDAEILVNDEIVTSDLGGIYPNNISIGNVMEVHVEESGLYKYALIKPIVDFENLKTVLIIMDDNEFQYIEDIYGEIENKEGGN